MGPIKQYLERETVYNVNCNQDDRIFVEERGRGKYEAPETMTELEREALTGILANETKTGPISRLSSRLAFDLPHGYNGRGQAFCSPVGSHWPLMLRNHSTQIIPWDSYAIDDDDEGEDNGLAPIRAATAQEAVREAIRRQWNIVIAGRMNAGKSTLLSSLLAEAAIVRPAARLVVVQDRDELRVSHRDHVKLFARVPQKRYEHDGTASLYTYDFPDLLEDVLRTSADAIAWGELRDSLSAVGLLLACNTGIRGIMNTVHSNGVLDTLHRIEELVETAPGVNFTQTPRKMIARLVNMVVYMVYDETTRTRKVGAVRAIRGLKDGEYVLDRVTA
ncbi:MAG: ATPase, T2SS/T4P/T4SS family [Vulcanimicrobiaceae bacterium]